MSQKTENDCSNKWIKIVVFEIKIDKSLAIQQIQSTIAHKNNTTAKTIKTQ